MTSTALAVLGMLVLAGLCYVLALVAIDLFRRWTKAMAEVQRLQRQVFDLQEKVDYTLLSSLERTPTPIVAPSWYEPTEEDALGFDDRPDILR